MKIPAILIAAVLLASAANAQQAPATQPQKLLGEIHKYTFDKSQIYPGTTRDYWIYIPPNYDPAKPPCLYVSQDGQRFNAPQVMDRLIADGKIPPMIGVFITPGKVPTTRPEALDRFNRSYEYDETTDDYVRFLLTELLPDAQKQTTSDGRPIVFSQSGNDHAIGGSSSGASCAFTAAWQRPDQFTRVFSAIGSYTGLHGANTYPILIRKFEPKPIRIYLQDGSADHNHYAGDWWMANQEMERALSYTGYEVDHIWGTGDHDHIQANAIFADAFTWLWKDWPTPVKAGKGSEQLQQILIPGEDWKLVAQGLRGTDGPAANAAGEIFVNDGASGKILKVGFDGSITDFVADSKKGAGQAFGPDGRLYAVATATQQILAYDTAGKATVIADGFKGNDLVVRSDGSIFVTNPGDKNADAGRIWYISPTGEKKVVDSTLKFPNGITLSPDQSLLYCGDYHSHWVYSWQIQPDGSLAYKQRFDDLYVPPNADDSGADGMRVDRDGRLYVSTRMGIQICDQAGRVIAIIPTPNGKVSNLGFGTTNFDILFATCGDKIYARLLKTTWALPFDSPFKPPPPKL